MTENDIPNKLLWMDLEMTGLDPSTQRIIEVACIVTDFECTELARFQAIIHQPDRVLNAAEDWPKAHMQQLFAESRESEKREEDVANELATFIVAHFADEPAVLAGNSIHQDRRFIRQWWPSVEKKLHYRMFDVSSFKIWVQGTSQEQYAKQETHRALSDIEESIAELKWCLERL